MNRSVSLVAAERLKVSESVQEFFNLSERILLVGELLLGKLGTGEVSVGEISGWGNCSWGSFDWGNCACF